MAKSANLYARIEPDVKEQTDKDLRSIYEYIAYDLQSPDIAMKSGWPFMIDRFFYT